MEPQKIEIGNNQLHRFYMIFVSFHFESSDISLELKGLHYSLVYVLQYLWTQELYIHVRI